MLNNPFLNYILIGLGVGLFFQIIHDIAVRSNTVPEEELPDFTIEDHIKIILLWPGVLLRVVTTLLFHK